jgi:hypothetical protein
VNPLYPTPGPSDATCATCAWHYRGGRGSPVDRCRRHKDARVEPDWPSCVVYEVDFDCTACGACCREAYHRVEISRRDPFYTQHPERVSNEEGYLVVTRNGPRCGCLRVEGGTYTCDVYADRPWTCREFTRGSANCLDARRRVGLTK